MTYRRLAFFLCIVGIAGLALPLQAQPHERTVRDTVTFKGKTVSIENQEGSISVSAWSRDAVAYEARIVSGQSAEVVEEAAIDTEQFNQKFSLESNLDAVDPEWSFGPEIYGYGVSHPDIHYTVTVPEAAALFIEDHESQIEVDGHGGGLEIDTHEGEVTVSGQRGPVQVDAHEGTIDVSGVRGDLSVDTHEGRVAAEGVRGDLRVATHEGHADVAVDSLGTVEVDTHEGTVAVSVPADAGFDLSTDLGSDAELRGDLDFATLQADEHDYRGAVQGGGPLFHVTSHEGEVVLRRQ